MIRPKPRPGTALPRGLAVAVTFLVLLGAQAGLKGVAVPAFASGRDMIRELDPMLFERFAAPPPPEPEAGAPQDEAPEEVLEEPASLSFDQEVGMAMEQLEERFASEPVAPTVGERSTGAADGAGTGIAADVSADRFESLFGADDGVVVGRAGRGRATPDRDGEGGLGIDINERLADDTAATADSGGSGPDVSVSTGADRSDDAEASEVEISEFSSESFDGSEADRLALWMRTNPGALPIGVRVHVNYEPTFLTSTALFSSDGRNWELFLMFNESLRELHLVLVDGDRSVYLIDRGFQEQSRSLREGTVRRTGGRIIAVDSRSGAASSDRAQNFYNVFLSWWEAAKVDVGSL